MARRAKPTRQELLDEIDHLELALRALGSDWNDGILPDKRLALLEIASRFLTLLIREGRRP